MKKLAPLSYTGDFSATDKDINLGWLDSGPGYYYEGTLDEVALYSRALTPGEIQQHYFTGLSGQGIDDLLTDVILLSPNGDEVIPSGSTYSIKWFAPLEAETFKLKFSVDNGATWKLIEEELTGTSYDWSVPTKKKNKKNCLVKVKAFDSNGDKIGVDQSDAPFTIEVLEVTSPNGEETLTSGDTYTITWTTNETKADVDKVKLLYTKNGGETWEKIETLEGGDPETYEWEVPPVNKVKTECRVKVTLKDELGNILGNDKSDSFFTIEPAE